MYNGHAYYQSDGLYLWEQAKMISSYKGGYLVTIGDTAENTFVYNNLRQTDWGSWIGLFNTGTPGNFGWVTGEPLNFTNWNLFEPNNYHGTATIVMEQYVHILGYDYLNRWNDMPAYAYLPFITEFEERTYTLTQISGPPKGSQQGPGVYTICYERVNTMTGQKDTCCFNVTVVCTSIQNTSKAVKMPGELVKMRPKTFTAIAYPNPSINGFTLKVEASEVNEKIYLRVMDIFGRVIELKEGISPNTTLKFGANYKPGIYFFQIFKKDVQINLKLIKE